ncbi:MULTISPECIES: hypothetical protein [unclassified Streptomyces]|uniref:hypothetical protein n=1 Tax=unclassified Streptomyces TaxID=2593676 RepID=UPI002E3606C1|nr:MULTISPECIES: hypothetical protein [unclassified Streptomyces]WUC68244.1 hypothetical protein OG861_30580 [Streptomyces sp. NBC_00539]
MSRFTDRWTGTTYPRPGVAARSAQEVRAALLSVSDRDGRFVVREGSPKEGADVVAEFEYPALDVTLRIRMRLRPATHEVRVLEECWEPTADAARRQYGRGPADKVYRQWEIKSGVDGRRHKTETFRFSTQDMRNPLQRAVLDAGWIWRGVLFKL